MLTKILSLFSSKSLRRKGDPAVKILETGFFNSFSFSRSKKYWFLDVEHPKGPS